jgi:hypothetical protein
MLCVLKGRQELKQQWTQTVFALQNWLWCYGNQSGVRVERREKQGKPEEIIYIGTMSLQKHGYLPHVGKSMSNSIEIPSEIRAFQLITRGGHRDGISIFATQMVFILNS